MANSYLSRTPSGAGSRTTWTFSAWIKRNTSSTGHQIFDCSPTPGTDESKIYIYNDFLYWKQEISNTADGYLVTNRKFRDTNAWYHIVCQWNTTDATASERMKIWINGVQETSFSTNNLPDQNRESYINSTTAHYIGSGQGSGSFFDGYMSHVAFVDGSVVAPTVFGETDSTSGIWKFKSPTGVTWGTNGFHLKFESSGALGTDSSGNTNTFTVNGNLKQALDTPSNNHATLNPLDFGLVGTTSNAAASNGNLTATGTGASWKALYGNLGVTTGKWYYEAKLNGTPSGSLGYGLGWVDPGFNTDDDINSGTPSHKVYLRQGTTFYANNSGTASYFGSVSSGDIHMMALDLDNGKVWFGINGTWQNSGGSGSNTTTYSSTTLNTNYPDASSVALDSGTNKAGVYAPCTFTYGTGASIDFNFGNGFFGTTAITSAGSNGNGSLFEYDVPSGFYALNTKNINTYG